MKKFSTTTLGLFMPHPLLMTSRADFSGLSKAYRVAGYRAGWVAVSGAKHRAADFLEGLTLLANMRICANVPAQHVIQTALSGYQSVNDLILPAVCRTT